MNREQKLELVTKALYELSNEDAFELYNELMVRDYFIRNLPDEVNSLLNKLEFSPFDIVRAVKRGRYDETHRYFLIDEYGYFYSCDDVRRSRYWRDEWIAERALERQTRAMSQNGGTHK